MTLRLFRQVALRRQQAQEEEMGFCSPVNLSVSEPVVTNETGVDYVFTVGTRAPSPTVSSAPCSPTVPGEVGWRTFGLQHCNGSIVYLGLE